MTRSIVPFVLAGLAEIGGGCLVWLWLREGRSVRVGVIGALVLVPYGVLPTLQPAGFGFGRGYAAYGGMSVVRSLAWGWGGTAGSRTHRGCGAPPPRWRGRP